MLHKERRPPGATGGREREDVPMVRGFVQRRRFSGGGSGCPQWGRRACGKFAGFSIYRYRPSAGWLGWRRIAVLCGFAASRPAFPERKLLRVYPATGRFLVAWTQQFLYVCRSVAASRTAEILFIQPWRFSAASPMHFPVYACTGRPELEADLCATGTILNFYNVNTVLFETLFVFVCLYSISVVLYKD